MPRAPGRPNLRKALAYQNDEVVHKFVSNWDVTVDEARELFAETLRMLWMVNKCRARGRPFKIEPALFILDQMWHTFALFTPEYRAYCRMAYGRFLDHKPTTRADRAAGRELADRDPAAFEELRLEEATYRWQMVIDTFGEQTLLKWWVELPTRYDQRFFDTAAIPVAMGYKPPARLVEMMQRRAAPKRRRA